MPLIFRYFWFIAAGFMLINIAIWRRRLAVIVSRGVATQEEADQFVRGLSLFLVGGPLLLGGISLAAGWSFPLCAGALAFDSVPRTLTSFVMIAGWLSLLAWVWRGRGADFLARVGPALGQQATHDKSYSPRTVRLAVTAIVLASAVMAATTSRRMPSEAGGWCGPVAAAK